MVVAVIAKRGTEMSNSVPRFGQGFLECLWHSMSNSVDLIVGVGPGARIMASRCAAKRNLGVLRCEQSAQPERRIGANCTSAWLAAAGLAEALN